MKHTAFGTGEGDARPYHRNDEIQFHVTGQNLLNLDDVSVVDIYYDSVTWSAVIIDEQKSTNQDLYFSSIPSWDGDPGTLPPRNADDEEDDATSAESPDLASIPTDEPPDGGDHFDSSDLQCTTLSDTSLTVTPGTDPDDHYIDD